MSQADTLLAAVLATDRALRDARVAFLAVTDHRAQTSAIAQHVERGMAKMNDEEHAAGLVRVADLLCDIADAESARLLVVMLGHEDPGVRLAAGESLVELMYERYAEVARVIESAIDGGASAIALAEIPFLLAEVGEPGGVKLAVRLLTHPEAEVVAAAVEALAAMGDPSAIKAIERLRNDKRRVAFDEEDDEKAGDVSIAELAAEAIDHLAGARTS